MNYYPVMLNISGKKCTVVGGGRVAERKVRTLLKYGASVSVVSPSVTLWIKRAHKEKKIILLKRKFRSHDITEETFLIICATDDPELNSHIASVAGKKGKLVNIVDTPGISNFIVPSSIKRGSLTICISTTGESPALAKKIRKELESLFGEEYSLFLRWMKTARKRVKNKIKSQKERKRIFKKLIESNTLNLIKNGKIKEAKKNFKKLLDSLI